MASSAATATATASTIGSTSSANATSSLRSVPTEEIPPTNQDDDERKEALLNYYFLFLILLAVLLAALTWWLHRRRRRRKEQMRLGGQNALARDLEGWANTRRFMHGRYGRNNDPAVRRREEGLDAWGEAPPPYQPREQNTAAHSPTALANDTTRETANVPSIPLRTLSRDNRERMERVDPPEYHDTTGRPNDNPASSTA